MQQSTQRPPQAVTVDNQRELLKGNTESLLLALLMQEPMYGYQLVKELQRRSQGYFQFREGTLYPALHRLEQDGLVEARWQASPNGQQRRYYYLTDKGRMDLQARLFTWNGFAHAMALVLASGRA